jgi:hypothetical protein
VAETIEGQTYRLFGTMISPSEAQLLDCTYPGLNACLGGNEQDGLFYYEQLC